MGFDRKHLEHDFSVAARAEEDAVTAAPTSCFAEWEGFGLREELQHALHELYKPSGLLESLKYSDMGFDRKHLEHDFSAEWEGFGLREDFTRNLHALHELYKPSRLLESL